jgi:diadenosine tetraphosphate (Ap4A) HIT family hydrolase
MTYDSNNIFAKILRGEIPCKEVYRDDFALAFHDIAPNAPQHILVIPKGSFSSFTDFLDRASEAEQLGFWRAVNNIAAQQHISSAFRLITNNGEAAGQSVHHFHVHLLAGKPMGPLLAQ